jgi:hypothetical protein
LSKVLNLLSGGFNQGRCWKRVRLALYNNNFLPEIKIRPGNEIVWSNLTTTGGDLQVMTTAGADANKVTVYTASRNDPAPVYLTVGLGPLGLAYIR